MCKNVHSRLFFNRKTKQYIHQKKNECFVVYLYILYIKKINALQSHTTAQMSLRNNNENSKICTMIPFIKSSKWPKLNNIFLCAYMKNIKTVWKNKSNPSEMMWETVASTKKIQQIWSTLLLTPGGPSESSLPSLQSSLPSPLSCLLYLQFPNRLPPTYGVTDSGRSAGLHHLKESEHGCLINLTTSHLLLLNHSSLIELWIR